MQRSDFRYELPEELIAQAPSPERGGSRLLHLAADGSLVDRRFRELPSLLAPGDLLIFNDTRVIPARLFGRKESGGRVELLVERVLGPWHVLAQVRASKAPKVGARIVFEGQPETLTVEAREDDLFRLRIEGGSDADHFLERVGRLPLPPYIRHAPEARDLERYQTVFARQPGAVAAPTAGLHFDLPLLEALRERGVGRATLTLHVGAGTFQPLRVERLEDHRMHRERFEIPADLPRRVDETRSAGGRVIAVGTTVARALESASMDHERLRAGPGETELFITPGYRFRVVDRLITNFHLPESTLLMLVAAFAGRPPVMAAYRHAVETRYRFFSYGDAMLVDPGPPSEEKRGRSHKKVISPG